MLSSPLKATKQLSGHRSGNKTAEKHILPNFPSHRYCPTDQIHSVSRTHPPGCNQRQQASENHREDGLATHGISPFANWSDRAGWVRAFQKKIIQRAEAPIFFHLVYRGDTAVFHGHFDKTIPTVKLVCPHFSQVV